MLFAVQRGRNQVPCDIFVKIVIVLDPNKFLLKQSLLKSMADVFFVFFFLFS